jgi:hypothetical protein
MSPTVFQEGSQLNDEQEDEEDEADATGKLSVRNLPRKKIKNKNKIKIYQRTSSC